MDYQKVFFLYFILIFEGYQQMKDDFPRKFSIYGKDVVDQGGSETDETDDIRVPPKMEQHSPVWSNIRKGRENGFIGYR